MKPELQDRIADLSIKIPSIKHLHPRRKQVKLLQGLVDIDAKHGYKPNDGITLPHKSDEYANDIIFLLESIVGTSTK